MKNKNLLLAPELEDVLVTGYSKILRDLSKSGHPAEIAGWISALSSDKAWMILQHADTFLRSEIFIHLDKDLQVRIISDLNRKEIAFLLAGMSLGNRDNLLKQLPESLHESVLPALAQAEREDIRRSSLYREGSAGAVMTSDYASLSQHLTTSQAIERLREIAPDRDTLYCAYVVDENSKLLGFVSLKDLIVARRDDKVGDIMRSVSIFSRVDDKKEDAVENIEKYDLKAMPVINDDDVLVGIITRKQTLDIKFIPVATPAADVMYMETSVRSHFRNRYPWVIALAILSLVSGYIVQSFEGLLMQFTVLMTFMPMLADTGGNTGSQSATLVIRALALKEISTKDVLRILEREFRVAMLLSLPLGAIAFGRVFFFGSGSSVLDGFSLVKIAFAISLALGLQVISSTIMGALLPLGATKLKLDPALVATPVLTTIVDITGLLIYFTTAKLILGI
ncbi:MAG: magnesium transporter [Synergistaceae bacterium]|nr:magnesium transporter [Synergistaceae bacterium]